MKVTVNVDCTPEEARAFIGLPDVQPMQKALMTELENQLRTNIHSLAPENLMATWMPAGLQNAEQLQKVFWGQLQNTLGHITNATTQAMVNMTEKK